MKKTKKLKMKKAKRRQTVIKYIPKSPIMNRKAARKRE